MEINYVWVITSLDCIVYKDGLNNIIKNIHWRYRGHYNDITCEQYGVHYIGEPNPIEFIEYENLTEEIIINWLENNIDVLQLKSTIESDIIKIVNPNNITLPLPSK